MSARKGTRVVKKRRVKKKSTRNSTGTKRTRVKKTRRGVGSTDTTPKKTVSRVRKGSGKRKSTGRTRIVGKKKNKRNAVSSSPTTKTRKRKKKVKVSSIDMPRIRVDAVMHEKTVRATPEESLEKMDEIRDALPPPDFRPLNIKINRGEQEPAFSISLTAPTPVSPGRDKVTYDIILND